MRLSDILRKRCEEEEAQWPNLAMEPRKQSGSDAAVKSASTAQGPTMRPEVDVDWELAFVERTKESYVTYVWEELIDLQHYMQELQDGSFIEEDLNCSLTKVFDNFEYYANTVASECTTREHDELKAHNSRYLYQSRHLAVTLRHFWGHLLGDQSQVLERERDLSRTIGWDDLAEERLIAQWNATIALIAQDLERVFLSHAEYLSSLERIPDFKGLAYLYVLHGLQVGTERVSDRRMFVVKHYEPDATVPEPWPYRSERFHPIGNLQGVFYAVFERLKEEMEAEGMSARQIRRALNKSYMYDQLRKDEELRQHMVNTSSLEEYCALVRKILGL